MAAPSASRTSLRAALVPRLAAATRVVPAPFLLACRPAVAGAFRLAPRLRARVAANMTAALGPDAVTSAVLDAYFANVADQITRSAAIYRSRPEGVQAIKQSLRRDPGFDSRVAEAIAAVGRSLEGGKGAVLAAPHLMGHEILMCGLAEELPVTVLARKSPDPVYQAIKQRWYAALGVEVVYRPPRNAPNAALEEMTAAFRCLRKNRLLALTPDLLQRPGSGIAVRLSGREAELPAGPFFLAVRTGAPLVPVFDYSTRDRFQPHVGEPLRPATTEDRDAAIADLAQQWTAGFEEFLRARPERWQFWLDKSWTRWLGN